MAWDDLSSAVQTSGIATALVYFIYRCIAGWYNTSMCLTLTTERFQNRIKTTDTEIILITMQLEHGEHGALFLMALEARVTFDNPIQNELPISKTIQFIGTKRVGIALKRKHILHYMKNNAVNWNSSPTLPYRLSPKEKTQFACFVIVPKDSICNIEAVLLGRKPLSRNVAQWRTSAISIPCANILASTNSNVSKYDKE